MNELTSLIDQLKATATIEKLEELRDLLSDKIEEIENQIDDLEYEAELEQEEKERLEYEATPEGKAEKEFEENRIDIWYNTPQWVCTIKGDKRKPNKFFISREDKKDWKNYEEKNFSGTQEQAIEEMIKWVGSGTPHSENPNGGFKTWVYRVYDYMNREYLN